MSLSNIFHPGNDFAYCETMTAFTAVRTPYLDQTDPDPLLIATSVATEVDIGNALNPIPVYVNGINIGNGLPAPKVYANFGALTYTARPVVFLAAETRDILTAIPFGDAILYPDSTPEFSVNGTGQLVYNGTDAIYCNILCTLSANTIGNCNMIVRNVSNPANQIDIHQTSIFYLTYESGFATVTSQSYFNILVQPGTVFTFNITENGPGCTMNIFTLAIKITS